MAELQLYKFQGDLVDHLGKVDLASRLIGDEMGLGKTFEILAIEQRLRDAKQSPGGKTLIVAPLSVHDHWFNHLTTFGISRQSIAVIDRKDRGGFIKALRGPQQYYICHYEATRLADIRPAIQSVVWFHIIADEVHRIKNKKAQQTRAVKSLRTKYKSGLSGSPADNKPGDLWSILNWLYPRQYSSYWRFVKTYCSPEEQRDRSGTTFTKWVKANPETIPYLRAEMRPYYMRRLKKQVLKDLPDKYYTDMIVDLAPAQRKMYDQMRKDMIAWVGEHEDQALSAPVVVAQLVRLQQFALAAAELDYRWVITKRERENARIQGREPEPERKLVVVLRNPSAKLDALEEVLADNPDEQFVVFSQFKSIINLAANRLEAKKITVGRYTGDVTNQSDRDATVAAFQNGNIRVLAGTIAAGGEGITLTASSTVVFLDRHWSPTKNLQAEDRLHRIGQKNAVQVIDLIARNTVDLGRRTAIATKWANLQLLLGDIVKIEEYKP